MKNLNFLILSLLVTLLWAVAPAHAQRSGSKTNIKNDIDSLGGNAELMEMAKNIKAQSRSRIVQERLVSRRNRVEFGLNYGMTFGGDAYLRTQSLGASLDYHITPRWSVGARYYDYSNNLSSEGERVYQRAKQNLNGVGTTYAVDIDYPENAAMAVLNWYPIYGKTSFLDMGVTQFDLYLLAGGGQLTLSSGTTGIYTGGLGVGAWMSKHLSARAEIRYQKYEDQLIDRVRSLDTIVGTVGFGWIL